MLALNPVVQSPRAYDLQNLTAAQLGTRLAAGANATLRENLRQAMQDESYRFRLNAAEVAFGLTAADVWFGYLPGQIERYKAQGDGVTDCTAAFLAAIAAVRGSETNISDGLGGAVDAAPAGVVSFGEGTYLIDPDTLLITDCLGLTIKGQGSRRTNNAIRSRTTLLFTGVSSGYGIKAYGNGARGLTIEDLDLCYDSSDFTGDVLDHVSAPGMTLNRVFVGTYGITALTRLQTARSCLRVTYGEFLHCNDCVFDGAVDLVWLDDARTIDANTFGGSRYTFTACVWYDCTGDMVRHDGNRTLTGLTLDNPTFNPISVDCTYSLDLNNVEGLSIKGAHFAGSVANKALQKWMRIVNCTGGITDSCFDDLSPAASLDGELTVKNNRIASTDGFTLTGGNIKARNNEFSGGTNGYTLSPTRTLCVDLGPDTFKVAVTTSYYVPAENANLSGRINYDLAADSSISKFSNASQRIQIRNVDESTITITDAGNTNLSAFNSGRTYVAAGAAGQTFTLPAPHPGCDVEVFKQSSQTLQVSFSSANLYTGNGAAKTNVSAANASDIGGYLRFRPFAAGYRLIAAVGAWSYT